MAAKSQTRETLEALLIAVIFAVFAKTFVFQAFKIPSGSMEENLLVGDHILVNKFVYGPRGSDLAGTLLPMRDVQRGDVVVFKAPQEPKRDFIKRCVGLPGDRVEIVNKRLFINGEPVEEEAYTFHKDERTFPDSRFTPPPLRWRDNYGPEVMPDGYYFCMGDNRDYSNDSRAWGPVPAENIKGRALLIYWSYDSPGGAPPVDWPGMGPKLKQLGTVAITFFPRTRWERTFQLVR